VHAGLGTGVHIATKGCHLRLISGELQNTKLRRIQQTVFENEPVVTDLKVECRILSKNVDDFSKVDRREIC
jgi:hypothetical protein